MGGTQTYDIKSILPTLPEEFLSKGTEKVNPTAAITFILLNLSDSTGNRNPSGMSIIILHPIWPDQYL